MTHVTAARNKHRGASDERDFARVIGGKRHPADTGGPEDILHPELSIQHKGGKHFGPALMKSALQAARAGAAGTNKLPAVGLTDRSGTRIQRWICFDAAEWAAYHGWPRDD